MALTQSADADVWCRQFNEHRSVPRGATRLPGISESDQGRIFEEFQQADTSITRAKGGPGPGLAISKRIVEMHGGESG
jgi:light-regulated signal transduction histidine kinase (bacteriophytochrome)